MVAVPMLMLFEMSTILSSFLFRKKLKKIELEENEYFEEILEKNSV
jgi:Sec-independent protein secretion pathway component TatC